MPDSRVRCSDIADEPARRPRRSRRVRSRLAFALSCCCLPAGPAGRRPPVKRHLYVVCPGIRNYLEFGGAGVLVFDIDAGHKFVKRIETPASREPKPDNIKGVCACAATKRLYFTTRSKLYCLDLVTGKTLWGKASPNGTDRMSITPDGKVLYVPSFEKDTWNVVDAATGKLITSIETKSGAHNTVVGLDGSRMYLGGLKSPFLFVADTKTHKVVTKVGPFGGAVRPFTVNGAQTRALRLRQRPARVRGRRPDDREAAAPGRGARASSKAR